MRRDVALSRASSPYMARLTRSVPFIALLALVLVGAAEAGPLFTKPLHVTRAVDEPLSGRTFVVEEYCFGNRVVTVRGDRTVIADYERREITEIDRAKATYSLMKFDDLAAAHGPRRTRTSEAPLVRTGSDRRGGRNVEVFTADDRAARLRAEIAVDPTIELSRDAFDVVIGAAYPADGGPAADLARGAAKISPVTASAAATTAADRYGLPIEQIVRWDAAGETIISSNRVTRVGDEMAPPDLMAIPPGARRVESHRLEAKRLADEIDSVPARKH